MFGNIENDSGGGWRDRSTEHQFSESGFGASLRFKSAGRACTMIRVKAVTGIQCASRCRDLCLTSRAEIARTEKKLQTELLITCDKPLLKFTAEKFQRKINFWNTEPIFTSFSKEDA